MDTPNSRLKRREFFCVWKCAIIIRFKPHLIPQSVESKFRQLTTNHGQQILYYMRIYARSAGNIAPVFCIRLITRPLYFSSPPCLVLRSRPCHHRQQATDNRPQLLLNYSKSISNYFQKINNTFLFCTSLKRPAYGYYSGKCNPQIWRSKGRG